MGEAFQQALAGRKNVLAPLMIALSAPAIHSPLALPAAAAPEEHEDEYQAHTTRVGEEVDHPDTNVAPRRLSFG